VVIPDDTMRPIEAMQKIGGAISQKDIRAVDVIVGKESEFNQRKQLPTIERTIFRDGVKLYGQERHSQIMVWFCQGWFDSRKILIGAAST